MPTHQSPLHLRVVARVPSMVFAEMQCEGRVVDKAMRGRKHRPSVEQRASTNDAAPAAGRWDGHCPRPLTGQGSQAVGDFAGGLHAGEAAAWKGLYFITLVSLFYQIILLKILVINYWLLL